MNSLEKGITIVCDLEMNNYLMNRYINRLRYEIEQLGKKRYHRPAPTQKSCDTSIIAAILTVAMVSAIIGAVVGVIAGFIAADSFIEYIFNPIGGALAYGFYFGIAGIVLGFVVGTIRKTKESRRLEAEYIQECDTHERRLAEEKFRIQLELKQQKVLLRQLEHMKTRKQASVNLLNQLYRRLNIDEKYRNIVPIAYMNEFVRLGISNHLDGTDGLYYLVRQELRWDQMQYTLSDISRKLDTLIDQSHALYGELKQINQNCERMLGTTQKSVEMAVRNNKQLESISESNAIIAYNTERIRKENSYQSFLMTI